MSIMQCIQDQAPYYRKLQIELKSEAGTDHELNLVKNERQGLADAIRIKKAEVNALEENSKKDYRDVRKLRHISFRSAAATLSGKKKELVAKEEVKYQLAFENEQRSKRDLDQLQARYNTAVTKEEQLVLQKSHFEETRHQFDSLLEQIFASDDSIFPSEPQIKAEIISYKEQRRLAKRDRSRFIEAERALSTCLANTKKVIRLLDTVVNYVPFDIFGGPLINDEQVEYLDAAKKRTWEIQRLLNVARTVLPEIPYPQTLDVVTNNTLLNMQINLNYVDVAWKVKTTQCFGLLATAYRNMQNSLTWVKQYLDYTTGAVIRLNEALETTKKALETERCRIMDSILAGHIDGYGGSSSSNNNGDIPFVNEPPPPVYETPAGLNTQENQQDRLSFIPSNITPSSSSLSNFNTNIPPQPITPILGDTSISPAVTNTIHSINTTANDSHHNNMNQQNQHQQQPYISHNINNPFQ